MRWAVTAHINGFNIQTAGLVIFIIGLVGVILSLFYTLWWAERDRPVRDPRYAQRQPPPPPY